MGYYNLFYILRNIIFNFRKIFKYITISFLSILFIAICLLLISSNKVSAETYYPTAFTSTEIGQIESVWNDYKNTFDTFTAFKDNNDYLVVNVFNSPSDFKVLRLNQSNYFYSNFNVVGIGYWIKVFSDNTRQVNTFTGATSNYTNSRDIGGGAYYYYLYGNIPIYDNDGVSYMWAPSTDIPPTIENFNNQNVVSSMVAGEYFDIVVIANDYSNTQIVFNINNGDLPIESEDKYKYIILDSNSPYLLPTSEGSPAQGWKIPKSVLIPIYDNCTYNMWLNYGENFALSTEIETLTTSFSALGKDMAITDTQDATQDINNFLRDNSFNNSSIVNNMPSNNVPDPTADQINNIFNMFRNTFSTENAQDVVFQVPHSNETITIPANLVTSHMPQPLLILIQSFYWFLICRFIVKDISKIVEHAKSGEILDATDGNIKTDLL